jgi:hypothetical protein
MLQHSNRHTLYIKFMFPFQSFLASVSSILAGQLSAIFWWKFSVLMLAKFKKINSDTTDNLQVTYIFPILVESI